MNFEHGRQFAEGMDRADPLCGWRDEFNFPLEKNGYSPVYLCGNSLGLQPRRAVALVEQELATWRDLAVDGHFHSARPWVSYHRQAAQGFAELTGARPVEVVAMNTLTVNLHVLMASFYKPTASRYKIVIESPAFPSDRYAAASQLRLHGFDPAAGLLEWTPGEDDVLHTRDLETLLEREGASVALLLLPGIQYYSGQVLDMAAICELGRAHGCAVGLDLAHAIGNIEMRLHDWAPDFAAWCTYKYLNSGPGAISGAFIHERHFAPDNLDQLHGWWGNAEATRFSMAKTFDPAEGAELWQMSNPPILALAPVIASLEMFEAVGMPALVEKSRRLTGYLDWLLEARFAGRVESITPRDSRGCQLSLVVREAGVDPRALFDALCRRNVTGDWREPDVIRVAPAPMYNCFSDVFEFVERLDEAWAELAA
ncbi:MAG TPA: kynureninase [Woeseiaceae bacterium]|nr:kynureninase [Woeseiaceae bacterium]